MTEVTAVASATQHSVTLTWTEGVGGGTTTGYQVQRSTTSGGPYTTIGTTTGASATTYVDTAGLVEGTTYFYVVEATGPGGVSASSNEVKALIPFQAPAPPTGLVAVVV